MRILIALASLGMTLAYWSPLAGHAPAGFDNQVNRAGD